MGFLDLSNNATSQKHMTFNGMQEFDNMDGHTFEYFCAGILRQNGFDNINVTRGSGDQGVDITAYKDGKKYAIQCKKYSSHLGNTPVQEVFAGKTFYKCDIAVVMTNQTFTQGAIDLANATGVLLWDRYKLMNMLGRCENNTNYQPTNANTNYQTTNMNNNYQTNNTKKISNTKKFMRFVNRQLNPDGLIMFIIFLAFVLGYIFLWAIIHF